MACLLHKNAWLEVDCPSTELPILSSDTASISENRDDGACKTDGGTLANLDYVNFINKKNYLLDT